MISMIDRVAIFNNSVWIRAVFAGVVLVSLSCSSGARDTQSNAKASSEILAAYYGLDSLPAMASFVCRTDVAGQDGMPVIFTGQLNEDTVMPEMFVVGTTAGELVTPMCATLRPAVEPLERRTVLLAGPFGTADAPPVSVEVVGLLEDENGNSLKGIKTSEITPLEAGPKLVLAERFSPDTVGLKGECPEATLQVVQITWTGGASGPQGSRLGEPQREGVKVTLENGELITPIALADDDPDNHVLLCLDVTSPATFVSVAKHLFYDPADDPNLDTSITVVPGER